MNIRSGEGIAALQLSQKQDRRARRVLVLLGAIVVLSIADLLVTLAHLQSIGMLEANPLAAYLIRVTDSSWILTLYKGCTVAVCIALLYRARHHVQGEIASWLALMILVGVSVMWHFYSEASDFHETVRIAQILHADEWLVLD